MAKTVMYFFVFMFSILLVMSSSDEISGADSSNEEHGGKDTVTVSECIDNSDCSPGEYCAKAEGDCNGVGTCQFKFPIATLGLDPVCGCDGNTYLNATWAVEAVVMGVASLIFDLDGEELWLSQSPFKKGRG